MANSLLKFSTFTAFLCIALMLSSTNEVVTVEAALCKRLSNRFTGICTDSGPCNDDCKGEGAVEGACHARGLGFACFCYFNC